MDTSAVIVAVASPPGRSLRGIVRISGAQTFELLESRLHFPSESGPDKRSEKGAGPSPPRGIFRARLSYNKFTIPIVALIFHAPNSYTGEDSVELQLPGNPVLLERVIDELLECARDKDIHARRAEPGEFTARAYFNGRLNLTQAEGVAATISAQSDAELRAAKLLLDGSLGTFARTLADELASALALVEAGIDFTDQEDVVAISPNDLLLRLNDLKNRIENQLNRSVGMEELEAIPWVVLIGEPNAGKSALFNALLGHERAVVSSTSGTTRDVLTEPLTIQSSHGPAEVMLVDLAGLDEERSTINELMQSAARNAIERAELILRCVPVNEVITDVKPTEVVVRTKCDLFSSNSLPCAAGAERGGSELITSAITRQGLDELRQVIAGRLSERAVSLAGDSIALRPRHEEALQSALTNLTEAVNLLRPIHEERALRQPELIASSMRAALDALARLAGEMTPDDVLGRIFSTFCVGK